MLLIAYGNVLHLTHINKTSKPYVIRQQLLLKIQELFDKYKIDTIIMDENKLFIDKIDRHPDPYVLFNVTLGYGIKVSIDDRFHDTINYILELPEHEWRPKVLNRSVKYSMDLYSQHIIQSQRFDTDTLELIHHNNYYRALCLSESVFHSSLIQKKYQVNC